MEVNDIVLIASTLTRARILEVVVIGQYVKLVLIDTGYTAWVEGIYRVSQLLPTNEVWQ